MKIIDNLQSKSIFLLVFLLVTINTYILNFFNVSFYEIGVNLYYLVYFLLLFFLIHNIKMLNTYLYILIISMINTLAIYLAISVGPLSLRLEIVLLLMVFLVGILYFMLKTDSKVLPFFGLKVSGGSLITFLVVYFVMIYLIIFFHNNLRTILTTISNITLKIIDPNLIMFNVLLLLTLFLFKLFTKHSIQSVFKRSGLLNRKNFTDGFLVFFLVFCLLHLHIWLSAITNNESISSIFTKVSVAEWLGVYIGSIFGTGLHEELIFRFIIFGALLHLLRNLKVNFRIVLSLFIAQLLFAFYHVPIMGGFDLSIESFLIIRHMISGLILAFLFIVTKNLWIPIFIHGFGNLDLPLFISTNYINFSIYHGSIIYIYALIIVAVLTKARGRLPKLPSL